MTWKYALVFFFFSGLCVNKHVDSQQTTQACFSPLGMESRKIPDTAITESSSWSPIHTGDKARLNSAGAWYAALKDKTPYIQVNLGQSINITGLATQGYSGSYVTRYKVSYSLDGSTWSYYMENRATKVFRGNSFGDRVITHRFNQVIVAQYIRVHPIRWGGHYSALRMELYGCSTQPHIGTPTPTPDIPGKPVNLRGIKINPTNITMAWDRPRDGSHIVTTYLVWYRARGSATSTNKVVTSTRVIMVSLLPYTVYDIKVQAWNSNGKGPWSDIINLKTAESVPDRAPGNVQVESKAPMSLDVSWQRIPSNHQHGEFQGYVVLYRELGDATWQTVRVSPVTLTVLLSRLHPGEHYEVKVAGYTRVGTGKWSRAITKAAMEGAPSPPRNLQATTAGPYSVKLTWLRPLRQNGHVRHYVVRFGESLSKMTHHKTFPYSSSQQIRYTLTGLKPKTTYFILVFAETSILGQRSATVTVRTSSDDSSPTTLKLLSQSASTTQPEQTTQLVLTESDFVTTEQTTQLVLTESDFVTTDSEKVTEPDIKDESKTTENTHEPEVPSAAAAVRHEEDKEKGIFKLILMTGIPAFVAFVLLLCLIAVIAHRRKKRKSGSTDELAMEMREIDRSGVTRGRGSTRYSAPTASVCDDVQKRCSCSSSKDQSLTRGNEYTRAPRGQAECCPLVDHEDKSHHLDSNKRVKSEEHIYAAIAPVVNPKQTGASKQTKPCYANQSEIDAASRPPHVYDYLGAEPRGPAYVNLPNIVPNTQASAAEEPGPAMPTEVVLEPTSSANEFSASGSSSPVPV